MLATLVRWGYPHKARTEPGAWGDAQFDASWPMEAIDAPGAWLVPASGRCSVAVVDTGVYIQHRDLAGCRAVAGTAWTDAAGHGTAVAGVVAASHGAGLGLAGVCPDVGLAAYLADDQLLDVLSIPALGLTPRLTRLLAALAELHASMAAQPRPDIRAVTLAKAGARATAKEAEDECRTHFLAPIRDLLADDLVVVLGGANAPVPAARCVPAAVQGLLGGHEGVIVVSGSEPPWGSPWERNADLCYPGQDDVDLWAPGGLQTTLGIADPAHYNECPAVASGPTPLNAGNSLAIPHVAGVAALLVRIDPTLGGAAVGRLIRETAEEQRNAAHKPAIRVLNAFAAALRAHNRACPDAQLAGYRVMIPHRLEFVGGPEELEGAVLVLSSPGHADQVEVPFVYLPKIGGLYAWCRFTAPASLPLVAELQHTIKKHGGASVTRCLWRGALTSLIAGAPAGAVNSAWCHPACPELRTIRLQGLAMTLVHAADPARPIARAKLRLRHCANGSESVCETALDGSFLLPFVEPGPHELLGADIPGLPGGLCVAMTLDEGKLYVSDPATGTQPFLSVMAPPRRSPWIGLWAGEVELAGAVAPGKDCDEVAGAVTVTMRGKPLDRTRVLDRCIEAISGDHSSYEEFTEEFGAMPEEDMPEFGRKITRVFSTALWRLTGAPASEAQELAMDDAREVSLLDWKEVALPPGFLVAEGADGLAVSLDLRELSRRFLQAHLERPDELAFPYELDLTFAWSLGYQTHAAADASTAYELRIALVERDLAPMPVPWAVVPTEGWPRRWRLVAGPLAGPIELSTAPGSPLRISADPEPAPPGCTSAIVEEPADTSPDAARVFAIGPAGEVGVISRWLSVGEATAVASHIIVTRRGAPVPA
ncbi:S8 family serine peptidase [Nannocystis sp.]|uniref:S8 family serine peptidase n=1 Tax=Nannocystis sp. TaxID=1962667 RepID=UPI0024243AA8|nr:S8 family serine peptidase [Nannocystis sp.]MBK7826775.1 hypothetical protein [Nannocystis sp.]MBK9754396.1 hypothetical protein [Nannocystis sp.]